MIQLPGGIASWLAARQIIIEIILVVLLSFTLLIKFLHLPGADESLMIVMLTLAAFYFLSGFFPTGLQGTVVIIAFRVFSISSAICVIGILFTILHLPGAYEQVMIGLLSLAASIVLFLFLIITSRIQQVVPLIIRFSVLGILLLGAFMSLSASVQ